MEIININKLVENTPINKLSKNYNNKLLYKINENFNNEEKRLFLLSFYTYLNYDKTNDYVIDLDDIWIWLGFSQKVKAKCLLEKNFLLGTDYKVKRDFIDKREKKGRGGHNKETFLLNIKTFKRFCIKADTKKANELHEYFIKLEEIVQELIVEESVEFKQSLDKQNLKIEQLENDKNKLVQDKVLDRHNLLYTKFANSGSLVYLVKVKSNEDNTWVVKIGESRIGIAARADEHKTKYEECVIMDCFLVHNSKDFESFLHSHPEIKPYNVSDLKGHEKERELFLIGKDLSYKRLIQIINDNIKNYNNNLLVHAELEKIKAENENLKLINTMKPSDNLYLKELVELNKKLLEEVSDLKKSNKEILEKVNFMQVKTTTVTNFGEVNKNTGPRLQQVNPETLKLVKIWDCMAEALKSNPKFKRASIGKAVSDNTIYQGFRWLFVDRELDPNKIYKIELTKETRLQNTGYIAKLNKEKTQILNVYLDRKTASKLNDYKSDSALDNPVKNGTETNGHYYMLYDSINKQIKDHFEKKNGKPILYKSGIGQYDSTNKLINEFTSKQECCQSLAISDKSLKKSLEKNIPYNGFSYKFLESKVKMI